MIVHLTLNIGHLNGNTINLEGMKLSIYSPLPVYDSLSALWSEYSE